MSEHFLVSLIFTIAFGVFDYVHNKATWSIKSTWFKYAAAIAFGTFAFSYLAEWKYFQLLTLGAMVVAFLFFFSAIAKLFKVKVPGAPLKVVPLLFAVALLASCQPDYHNKVEKTLQSSIYKQSCVECISSDTTSGGNSISWLDLSADPKLLDSINNGYVDTERISTAQTFLGPVGMYNFTHKILLIKKTGYQNWVDFWHTAWRIAATILGAIFLFGGLYKYITISNNNKNAKVKQEGTSTMIWLIPVFIGCMLLGCGIYPWSSEGYEPRYQYDANQAKDGDQRAFDWNNIHGL